MKPDDAGLRHVEHLILRVIADHKVNAGLRVNSQFNIFGLIADETVFLHQSTATGSSPGWQPRKWDRRGDMAPSVQHPTHALPLHH
ncbi:MAG: hypothetical protein KDD84_21740 [Caldilineaceae bacterium]|nr:hypothetical protein [Caldilineaceae bacterium]